MNDIYSFPADFEWGTATASYQVEGAVHEDGRSESIWDVFAREPGKVYMGADGSVACDQYHRYEEDIALIASLGFKAYRFSIAWPRIIPDGTGAVNEAGLDYYRRLCDSIHAHGMKATATVYHWDLPAVLQEKGGWTNRDIVDAFESYAEACFRGLGDKVDSWITINEPFCVTYLGYYYGEHAPGHHDLNETIAAIHHVNLAHGRAVQIYRQLGLKAPIGITWNLSTPRPYDSSSASMKAVEYAIAVKSRVFTDPVLKGSYPDLLNELGFRFPVKDGDMETISQPIDFIGLNYYTEDAVVYSETNPFRFSAAPDWHPVTDMGWPIIPDGLLRQLRWISSESGNMPLYITENGSAEKDELTADGRVHDAARIDYLRKHFKAAAEAIGEGINLKGYYIWSFIDNFEWAKGYSKRFGIVYCDYATLERIPKDSAYFAKDVITGLSDWI